MTDHQDVTVPQYLVDLIERHLVDLHADSVESYVEDALRQRLNDDGFPVHSPDEERELEKRLRDLGYLS